MRKDCAACGSATEQVLDLGTHRLPDFTGKDARLPPQYPLKLRLCPACTLLQLGDVTPRESLYHERYGFKSGVNEAVRADLESVVKDVLKTASLAAPDTWLDIGCNDGTLLSYVPETWQRYGIDPLGQFADEARQHANVIIKDYFSPVYFEGKFGVITSVSMFYDLADPGKFVQEVKSVLHKQGIWIIQQNYALKMLTDYAVDNICHEHVTYFSVTALQQLLRMHGLRIFRVEYSPVNGGCFRAFVSHEGNHDFYRTSATVMIAVQHEADADLGRPATWRRWGGDVRHELQKTADLLTERAVRAGNRIYLYGASTRGGTILQMIGAGPKVLPFAVERQQAKVGKIMAATGIPIISEEQMREDDPDYLLISPWFFRDVFVQREKAYLDNGGRMIFPLPRFEVVQR